MRRMRFVLGVVGLLSIILTMVTACGSGEPRAELENLDHTIIGGTPTTGEPAVVAVYAKEPDAEAGSLCTGTVISSTVVLTAAHCVAPEMVGANAEFKVFMGWDLFDEESAGPIIDVAEVHHDPLFNRFALLNGHDIAVVILAEAVDVEPIPYMREPLTDQMTGQDVRIIGYGLNKRFQQTGAGIKRVATVALNSFDNLFVRTGQWTKGICSGDSGGPVLLEVDGVETIVGVNSFGFIFCLFQSSSTRVDAYLDFVDPFLE